MAPTRVEFRDGRFAPYIATVVLGLVLNVLLYRTMERRASLATETEGRSVPMARPEHATPRVTVPISQ